MVDCSKCKNADRCEAWDIDKVRKTGKCEVYKPITNADKIRSMSDEELAEFLEKFEVCSNCEYMDKKRCTLDNPCVHGFAFAITLKWLQSEAE